MGEYGFEYPLIGLLLLLFIVAEFLLKKNIPSFYIPHLLSMPLHVRRNFLVPALKWLGISMAILALMSPFSTHRNEPLQLSHTIMLLIDVSESMNGSGLESSSDFVKDMQNAPELNTKFQLAKYMAAEFVKKQASSNVGVIVFGDFAYVATPLTYDKDMVATILNGLDEGIAGTMTAMYDALFLGVRLLKKNDAKEKVVILLTDGYNTAGRIGLEPTFRAIESEKIRVYTIGVGKKGEYDVNVLKKLATISNGEFFEANSAFALKEVYAKIDELERSLQRSTAEPMKDFLYIYPLLLSLLSLMGYFWYTKRQSA